MLHDMCGYAFFKSSGVGRLEHNVEERTFTPAAVAGMRINIPDLPYLRYSQGTAGLGVPWDWRAPFVGWENG